MFGIKKNNKILGFLVKVVVYVGQEANGDRFQCPMRWSNIL